MGRIEINEAHEAIHSDICERIRHAERKHPEKLTPSGRYNAIVGEMLEVADELEQGNWPRTYDEYLDVGATLYRAMKQLRREYEITPQ